MSIQSLSHVPFNYSAKDVIEVLRSAFDNPRVTAVATFIDSVVQEYSLQGNDSGGDSSLIRNFFALPLFASNIEQLSLGTIQYPEEMQVTGYLAKEIYRVVISEVSLYAFTCLSALALVWCGSVLVYCWGFGSLPPNMSQYPEINFASRCSSCFDEDDTGMGGMLKGLGNATSADIEKRIKGKTVYVGATTPPGAMRSDVAGMIVLATTGKLQDLRARKKYL